MSIITEKKNHIETLARQLDDSVKHLKNNGGIEDARQICMKARKLYTGFEQETIWREEVDENERTIALQSLITAFEELTEISEDISETDRLKYIKIMIAMGERVTLVRHASFSAIRDYLHELAVQLISTD